MDRFVVRKSDTQNTGELFLFQILWKGSTERCYPKIGDTLKAHVSPLIYHDHAKKKTQNHATFLRLVDQIVKRAREVIAAAGLPMDTPIVVVIDNVPSHIDRNALVKLELHIYRVAGTILGLPNRSHVLNSGDHLINVTCRAHVRQRSKLRLLRHCMKIAEGKLAKGTPLDLREEVIKPLLTLWLSEWITDPQMRGWVLNSWEKALTIVPEITSVDDVPPPAEVIRLPAPPSLLVDNPIPAPPAEDLTALIEAAEERERNKWKPATKRKRARQPAVSAAVRARASAASASASASEPARASASASAAASASASAPAPACASSDSDSESSPSDSSSGGSTSSETTDDARQKSRSKRPKKRSKVASPVVKLTPDANVVLFLKNLGYQQYAGPLAEAGFTSMAELSLITAKALKDANVLEGHSLRILDHLKKRRALGVAPKAVPADFMAKRKARV